MLDIKEKSKRVQEAREILKKEFVGIDKIIDNLLSYISPWYFTPELIERPIVISLFGLTGTGKTSLVRRLLNLLEISDKSMFFDCGEQLLGNETFSNKLSELFDYLPSSDEKSLTRSEINKLGLTPGESNRDNKLGSQDFIFVLDEFQLLRTIKSGEEVDRPQSKAIWNLIDSGLIDINSFSRRSKEFLNYLSDLIEFSEQNPGTKIEKGQFTIEDSQKLKKCVLHFKWYDDLDEKEKKGYRILEDGELIDLIRSLNLLKKGLGFSFSKEISNISTLEEFIKIFDNYLGLISKPKLIDCSKSLIFILGNIDEAYTVDTGEINPDIDADVYHEITSKVNIMDIKRALRGRFRDEQIARLGNNIIIYPSLRHCDFDLIIKNELNRISEKFIKNYGLELRYGPNMADFIYSEGVYPIQGVRPVITTINSIITPRISEAFLNMPEETTCIVLDSRIKESRVEKATITTQFLKGDEEIKFLETEIISNLGSLRDTSKKDKLAIMAVHEASHSVLYSRLLGRFPSSIVALTVTGDGGFMQHDTEEPDDIMSCSEFENEILISFAGYVGEREFFPTKKCTLGSGSDFQRIWNLVSKTFGHLGYGSYYRFTNGNGDQEVEYRNLGLDWKDLEANVKTFIDKMYERCKELIIDEKPLIRKVAEYLLENRCMGTSVYSEYIDKYASTFNTATMKELREMDKNYYTKTLLENG